MKTLSLALIIGVVIARGISPAQAISEVGNARIGDEELGFVARLPRNFSFLGKTVSGGAKLATWRKQWSSGWASSPFMASVELEMRRLDGEFPESSRSTRLEFRERFLSREGSLWRSVEVQNPCVEAYAGTAPALSANEPGLAQAIVAWGAGRGIILLGPAYSEIEAAMREILESLELAEGACSWN